MEGQTNIFDRILLNEQQVNGKYVYMLYSNIKHSYDQSCGF